MIGFLIVNYGGFEIKALKVNEEIAQDEMLLIDEEGRSQGKVSRDQALYLAFENELDLVLINENAHPPIARLMDYGKYIYTQTKQESKQKAKTHGSELKEVRFGLKIDEHDLDVKINKIKKFFDQGDRVKVCIQLRGREMMFRDRVSALMERVRLATGGTLEKPIDKMGTRFFATLVKSKNEIQNS